MADKTGFSIEVSSSYAEFWRYNVALMCGCFDAQGLRTDFAATEDTVADVGADLTAAPGDYPAARITVLETPIADHIVLYIYIIPHTLPRGRDVAGTKPFPLHVCVTFPGHDTWKQMYQINQWSGASIELKLPQNTSPAYPLSEK